MKKRTKKKHSKPKKLKTLKNLRERFLVPQNSKGIFRVSGLRKSKDFLGKKAIGKKVKQTKKSVKSKLSKTLLAELKKLEKKVLHKGKFIDHHIKVGNKRINYIYRDGKGIPIILLHGAGGNAHIYSSLLPFYKRKNPIYLLTMPGFGRSESLKKTLTLEHYSKMINKFLVKKKMNKIILIGHSIGGATAIVFAKFFPKKVHKLIVVSPAGLHPDKKLTIKRVISSIKSGLKRKKKRKDSWNFGSTIAILTHILNPFTWIELDYFSRFSIKKYLPIRNVKTLILWPSHDHCPETPSEVSKIFHKQLKHSKLKYVSGDHNFPLLFPRRFWKQVNDFLGFK